MDRLHPRILFLALAWVAALAAGTLAGASPAADPPSAEAFEWRLSTPEAEGMDGAAIERTRTALAARQTKGLLVIRNDAIVCEWYAEGHGAGTPHYTASMAKAIVGGVSLAVAMGDGLISLDDPAAKFVPQWKVDPRKSTITVRHLGSHTSGVEDAEADGLPHERLTGWKGDFWKRLDPPRDPFTLSCDAAPILFEPGERLAYSNPGIAMLSWCVTAALRDAPEKDLRALLRDRVMRPIGVPDAEWSIGYGETSTVEGLPLVAPWGGGGYTARAAARVGRLLLREGDWEGRRLIPSEAVRLVTRDAGTPGGCGIGWWSNGDGAWPEIPKDAFWGSGAGHQILLVVPSLRLIAVRNGGTIEAGATDPVGFHEPVRRHLFRPLMEAIVDPGSGARPYYPPPESKGGWRKLEKAQYVRDVGGMDPESLAELQRWLLASDDRNFAAVVIRRGWIVLEVERGNSAATDSRRVASVSKAVCATVLAIASERSQKGLTPRRMAFDDPAFQFLPWAQPLSDPRKARITVQQLLNHTSGICPEATGAPNDGSWEYVLGLTGDPRTATLAFDPGTGCGYSTHALHHASLVCESVTGKPYDEFAIEALFKPVGIERWWFQSFEGGEGIGSHPTHGLGMPARDLARIAYCMVRGGGWEDRQVIPKWFVEETARPTSDVKTPEMRWKLNPQVFSHGWELPALHWADSGRSGAGIPADARTKPGSGGQLIAFVPSLDLVVTRQTGSSGDWAFEEYLRRACAAVLPAAR